jgi:hypothetical protein
LSSSTTRGDNTEREEEKNKDDEDEDEGKKEGERKKQKEFAYSPIWRYCPKIPILIQRPVNPRSYTSENSYEPLLRKSTPCTQHLGTEKNLRIVPRKIFQRFPLI